jgi:hypothetical protein
MFLGPASTRSLDRFRTARFHFWLPTPVLSVFREHDSEHELREDESMKSMRLDDTRSITQMLL